MKNVVVIIVMLTVFIGYGMKGENEKSTMLDDETRHGPIFEPNAPELNVNPSVPVVSDPNQSEIKNTPQQLQIDTNIKRLNVLRMLIQQMMIIEQVCETKVITVAGLPYNLPEAYLRDLEGQKQKLKKDCMILLTEIK